MRVKREIYPGKVRDEFESGTELVRKLRKLKSELLLPSARLNATTDEERRKDENKTGTEGLRSDHYCPLGSRDKE